MWARVENNQVMEIVSDDPTGRYGPLLFWLLIPVEQENVVKPGWIWGGATFSAPREIQDLTQLLAFGWPGAQWSLSGKTYAELNWLDSSPKPTEEEINALVLDYTRAKLIAAVKAEAGRRIEQIVPQWKQLNMVARAVELSTIKATGTAFTPQEAAEDQAILSFWAKIKLLRQKSNEIEAYISASTILEDFNVKEDSLWQP